MHPRAIVSVIHIKEAFESCSFLASKEDLKRSKLQKQLVVGKLHPGLQVRGKYFSKNCDLLSVGTFLRHCRPKTSECFSASSNLCDQFWRCLAETSKIISIAVNLPVKSLKVTHPLHGSFLHKLRKPPIYSDRKDEKNLLPQLVNQDTKSDMENKILDFWEWTVYFRLRAIDWHIQGKIKDVELKKCGIDFRSMSRPTAILSILVTQNSTERMRINIFLEYCSKNRKLWRRKNSWQHFCRKTRLKIELSPDCQIATKLLGLQFQDFDAESGLIVFQFKIISRVETFRLQTLVEEKEVVDMENHRKKNDTFFHYWELFFAFSDYPDWVPTEAFNNDQIE